MGEEALGENSLLLLSLCGFQLNIALCIFLYQRFVPFN